ncbi:MAG: NYN domain-containing protein, partial [Armatimonadota bacterium]|nr:NYN domain-containing protein [Armatimonadota bacterium]
METLTGLQGLKIALLIDFDNVILGVEDPGFDVELVVNALRSRGIVVMGRAYGDWYRHNRHRRKLMEQGIELVETPVFGPLIKNSADIRIVLDAFEIAMLQTHIDAFCLVSGDSDFLPLIKKLQYLGKQVIVIAGNKFTSDLVRRNCNEFISYENLLAESVGATEDASTLEGALHLLARSINTLHERGMEVRSSTVKQMMLQLNPAFSERNFGCNQFKQFLDKAVRAGVVTLGSRDPVSGEYNVLSTRDIEDDAALVAAMEAAPAHAAPEEAAPEKARGRAAEGESRALVSRNGRRTDRRLRPRRDEHPAAPSTPPSTPEAPEPQPAIPDLPVDEQVAEPVAEAEPIQPEPVEATTESSNGHGLTTRSLLNRAGLRPGRLRFSGKSGRTHRQEMARQMAEAPSETAPPLAEQPSVEEPVIEQPVEQPFPEEGLVAPELPEQPVLEQPLPEEPLVEPPVAIAPEAAETAVEVAPEPAPKKRASRGRRKKATDKSAEGKTEAAPEMPQPEANIPEVGGTAESPAEDVTATTETSVEPAAPVEATEI